MSNALPELQLKKFYNDVWTADDDPSGNPYQTQDLLDAHNAQVAADQHRLQSQTDYEEEEKRRRAGLTNSINPTGGAGDTSTPNLAAKSLLGF